jgi:hypothetical protein
MMKMMVRLGTACMIAALAFALIGVPRVANAAAMPTCAPGDAVVWVNTKSHVYHTADDKYYGKTKVGDYECLSKAIAAGAHAPGSSSKHHAAAAAAASADPDATDAPSPAASAMPKRHKHKHHAVPSPTPSP